MLVLNKVDLILDYCLEYKYIYLFKKYIKKHLIFINNKYFYF